METLEKDVGRLEVTAEVVTEQVKELKEGLAVDQSAIRWIEEQIGALQNSVHELREKMEKLLAERELPVSPEEEIIDENDLEPVLPETIIELPATPATPRRRIAGII